MGKKKIEIKGIAQNSKAGAILLTESNVVYYIEGLDEWDHRLHGKKMKVVGYIKTENFKEEDLINKKGEWTQGMVGEKKSIIDAKWELLDN